MAISYWILRQIENTQICYSTCLVVQHEKYKKIVKQYLLEVVVNETKETHHEIH
jgi:hypothetical protein